jgi:hypothetical protein
MLTVAQESKFVKKLPSAPIVQSRFLPARLPASSSELRFADSPSMGNALTDLARQAAQSLCIEPYFSGSPRI